MSAEHQYFYEDEVFRINKKGVIEFGMVLENSELVSSDDDSDVEESGKMKKGHIRVAWHPTGEEEVLPEKKVGLADRSLMPGDVVRRMIKGKDTQRGYCRDIKVTACLQVLGTKRVIMNVKSEDLVPLEEFAADIAVCLDSWVGGIKMAQSKLMLQFSDGSRCKVTDPEAFGFDVFDEKRDSGCEFPHRGDYYPGQVLWGPLHTLQDAQWLHCSKELHSMLSRPNKTVKVMVESLETKSVTVHWQCRAYSKDGEGGGGGGENKEQPTAVVCGDKLKQMKLLNVFEPCTLQVGDRNMYTLLESDQVTSKEQWRKAQKEAVVSSLFSAVEPATYRPPLTPHYAPKRRHKRQAQGNRQQHAKFHDTHEDRVSTNNSTTALSNANSQASVVIDSNTTQTNKSEDKVATNCDKVTSESTTQQPKQAKEEEKKEENIPSANPNQKCDKTDKTDCDETTNSSKPGDAAVTPVVTFSAHNLIKGGDEWETDSGGSDVDYMSDTCSSSTASSSTGSTAGGRGLAQRKALALMTKMLKKKSLRRARKKLPPVVLLPGTRLAVETLSTASSADVVWQDGSVEYGIPSTQLYPIHHLDDQEFFPGDFVIENHEDHSCMRVYGVVQSVDHAGRTARVNWFKTYASADDPKPTLLQKSEVSVYDLKDHPDFQYRPGTVVIRVANFEGEDANCTAGQVLDNYPEGRVRVWWVDGHISMCWPQDLYKVGEYDSDEDELWDDSSSEASWETESEVYCIADEFINVTEETDADNLKPKLAANIEKARIAMSRLEEIFTHNPALQTTDVMRKLLEVYKDCRYLDKLMGTSFFHESHFQGLLERVRERGRANVAQRVADQVSRLFNQPDSQSDKPANHLSTGFETETQMSERSSNSDSGVVDGSPPNNKDMMGEFLTENLASLEERVVTAANNSRNKAASRINKSQQSIKSQLINQSACDKKIIDETVGEGETLARAVDTSDREAAMASKTDADKSPATELITEKSPATESVADKSPATKLEAEKSPVDSTTDSNTGCEVAERLGCATSVDDKSCCDQQPQPAATDADETLVASSGDLQTPTVCNSHVCVKLCSLILAQLVKAHTEVMRRYGGNTTGGMTLSDAANTVSPAGSSERDAADPPQTPEALAADESVAETVAGVTEDCDMPAAAAVATVNGTADDTPGTATLSPCTTPVKESEPVLSQSSCTNLQREGEGFSIMETAPNSHKFKLTMFLPNEPKAFFKTVRDEIRLLRTSLPQGIWVKGFEDRMDLYSVMIRGPEKTPYEDGLFLFDFQLSADYPKAPPLCHYVSYCSDRLNPNLYEDGKVCVSLLGTWSGKGTEVWTPKSNLLQVIVSIQGLILVSEPYFNEAGYEKQKGSQQGRENSRMYNEMVVLKLVQSMTKLINHPPPIFKEQITEHFTKNAPKMISRLNSWLEVSERYNDSHPLSPTTPNSFKEIHSTNEAIPLPEFPLIPASKGFCLTLRKSLATFTETLKSQSLNEAERRNSTTTEVDNCS